MTEPNVFSEGVSVVLLGEFSPPDFSPKWFHDVGLIGKDELLALEVNIYTPQASIYRLGWLRIDVMPNRLGLMSQETPEFPRVQDAAVNILRLKDETSLNAVGLNRFMHINMSDNRTAWHRIGDTLAPKAFWSDHMHLPGTTNVAMQGARRDQFAGTVNVTLQPSNLIRPGIFLERNDHYALVRQDHPLESRDDPRFGVTVEIPSDSKASERFEMALDIISNHFQASMEEFDSLVRHIYQLGSEND